MTDELCASLRRLGVDAKKALPGRPEQLISDTPPSWILPGSSTSLGVIDISEGPIRWIHLIQQEIAAPYASTSVRYVHYGVPTPKMTAAFPKVKIRTVRKKSFLFVGRVKHIQWRGRDSRLGIVDHLNGDILLRNTLAQRGNDVRIRAYPDHGCWTITEKSGEGFRGWGPWLPTKELWDCYQAMARHLLATLRSR